MKTTTLAEAFLALREKKGKTQEMIGDACDLSKTTPWKVENGKTVRWETMHVMLVAGLECHPGSSAYENIHRLWIAERVKKSENTPDGYAKRKAGDVVIDGMAPVRKAITGRPVDEVRKIVAAALRKAAEIDRAKVR